ncbi:MAG: 50S ribosomal protein L21 [Candidatus Lloydbacteria bacterium RIFCSPLOWO2_01_FULL_50_20]|uniref:Large ribosomal subunit protein bL21 n=1 Tax=Candidatus Lloydbacteria bacterium RIFCSPLOWO2_01_FULL_50_20 TaxID=1798665 RepID=A0A1G2DJG9_9BACT|nr:MAG: 50S ribosomal protein L21 [Candidatus Lloydbacteria bacterium RIFCSPHIGHO2_02_FULL_50_11]OGZ13749.1 MAG: 50S ribosomal protein L21 [Candidatus Lloydbacteria bacterium RIFCSPLOWO2_01_FULL_50_20]
MATKSNSASTGHAFAVIETGGKQYQVGKGDILKIEKLSLPAEAGAKDGDAKITFEEVLLVDDGKTTTVGTPHVSGAKVTASVVGTGRHKKVLVVRYLAKSRYYKKNGHRQPFTEVKIESVG